MAAEYTIRPAASDDAEAVAEMWTEMAAQHAAYDGEHWGWAEDAECRWRSHFLEMIEKEDSVVLIAADPAGRAAGFITAGVSDRPPVFAPGRMGTITNLYVAVKHRRKGVGRKLTKASLEAMAAKGADQVRLSVAAANEAAVRLYEKLGLRTVMVQMYKRL